MRLLLSSPAFDDKGEIPKKYGYKNENSSPPLSISNVPSECKSLALIMDDPDAKKAVGKTWTHWLVWNIRSDTVKIVESSIPNGCVQGMSDLVVQNMAVGSAKYGGPAPPDTIVPLFCMYSLDPKAGADFTAKNPRTAKNPERMFQQVLPPLAHVHP